MDPDIAHRFDAEFAPRIAERIAALLGPHIRAEVRPYGGHGHPTHIDVTSTTPEHVRGYPHALHLTLTWDSEEIDRLVIDDHDGTRFARYLDALTHKLPGWQSARGLDFGSRTQTEPAVLLGGLDFEA
ncbi:DUF5594 family protein [Burkholderia sp. Ac-20379]|uniref:DUF5594 family protein n=1 Tax=Burkholderia sp. Ac-20379 TaxID=2703900 RepID=UPI0019815D66|nr:DUF5594 family protein [Burkholderia sp. Ac-20379]MBN3728357.1 hypothetical protein [Burkholderia sp. Ac-20379]